MKKITFLIATLFSLVAFAQTYTEDFSTEILAPVLQDGSNEGLNNSYFSTIASGDGIWYTVQGFGVTDFGIQPTGGNSDQYVGRISETQFARGLAYVYNNADASVTGSIDLSFDYFFNTSFDNASTTNDRFGIRVWGISTDSAVEGVFPLSSGSGDFGDNNATNYTFGSGEETQLLAHTHFAHSNSWTNSGNITIDYGSAGDYDIIVVVFGQVFGTIQTGNPVATYFGIDNVVLPTQSNPQPTVLSTKKLDRTQFSVYPNPANDILNVQSLKGSYSYKIYEVTGKLIQAGKNKVSNQINISTLNNGLYLLELTDSKNIKSISKIIKN